MKLSEIFELKRLVRSCNSSCFSSVYYVSDTLMYRDGAWSCCLHTTEMFFSCDFLLFMEFCRSHNLQVSVSSIGDKPYCRIQ